MEKEREKIGVGHNVKASFTPCPDLPQLFFQLMQTHCCSWGSLKKKKKSSFTSSAALGERKKGDYSLFCPTAAYVPKEIQWESDLNAPVPPASDAWSASAH